MEFHVNQHWGIDDNSMDDEIARQQPVTVMPTSVVAIQECPDWVTQCFSNLRSCCPLWLWTSIVLLFRKCFAQTSERGTHPAAFVPRSSFHSALHGTPGSACPAPFVSRNIMTFLLFHLHPRAHDLMSSSILAWRSRCDPDGHLCVVCTRTFLGTVRGQS